jgi:AraC-like DNA-binding protein
MYATRSKPLVDKNGELLVCHSTVSTEQSSTMTLSTGSYSHDCHIGILIDNGHFFPAISAVSRAFEMANRSMPTAGGQPPYRVSLLSRLGGHVTSSSTIAVWTQELEVYSLRDFHAVFVANHDMLAMPGSGVWISRWLTSADKVIHDRERGAQYFVVDKTSSPRSTIPVFWLGHRSCEDWPSIQMAAELALAQIATDRADNVSIQMASSVSPPVETIANPRSDDLSLSTVSGKIRESCRWINENFGNDISVSDAAAVAAMSVRNYLRRFKNECGVTPLEYLMRLRFEAVCQMMVGSELPFDKIARHCGMGSGDRMGRLFRKRYGVSPTVYQELLGNKESIGVDGGAPVGQHIRSKR